MCINTRVVQCCQFGPLKGVYEMKRLNDTDKFKIFSLVMLHQGTNLVKFNGSYSKFNDSLRNPMNFV